MEQLNKMTLEQIIKRGCELYGDTPQDFTDKETPNAHSYAKVYDQWMTKTDNINFLEVGISNGGSIYCWNKFFTDSTIYAVDLASKYIQSKSFQNELANSTNVHLTWSVDSRQADTYRDMPQFDYIVDDGDHTPSTQILTFQAAYPKLKSGGIYFIEDILTPHHVDEVKQAVLSIDPTARITTYLGDRIASGRLDDIILIIEKA